MKLTCNKNQNGVLIITHFMLMSSLFVSCDQIDRGSMAEGIKTDTLKVAEAVTYEDKISRYLAGIPQEKDNDIRKFESNKLWKRYSKSSDSSWARLKREKFRAMNQWVTGELQSKTQNSETVFYPFGGPDLLHAVTFFPNAKNYILIGLEPVGSMPTMNELKKDSLKSYFPAIDKSLNDILNFSFFKTNNMATDLRGKELDGSLPLFLIFLQRTGYKVISTDTITIKGNDPKKLYANGIKDEVKGIRIDFQKNNEHKTLYYFKVDLTDFSFREKKSFTQFLGKFNTMCCFLKSASYLMHRPHFSLIKSFILQNSSFILEDESGVPYNSFDESQWNLQFYGNYMMPIYLFTKFYDVKLQDRFKKEAHPLPFGIGYRFRDKESHLILAIRKK